MEHIPVVASVDDLEPAIQFAEQNQHARWYVARRAVSLGKSDLVPKDWCGGVVAAFGGDYTDAARKKAKAKGQTAYDGAYPIADVADLRRAIQAYGRAKNKPKAKAHIISRAKALGATKMLPNGWGAVAASGDELEDPQAVDVPVDDEVKVVMAATYAGTQIDADAGPTTEDMAWAAIEALTAFVAAADVEAGGTDGALQAAAKRYFEVANDQALAASGETDSGETDDGEGSTEDGAESGSEDEADADKDATTDKPAEDAGASDKVESEEA